EPARPVGHWSGAVLPAIPGDEVPAGVAPRGHTQLTGQGLHVGAERLAGGLGMGGLVDSGVHAPAEVFHERAEGVPADGTHGEGRVQDEVSGGHGELQWSRGQEVETRSGITVFTTM